MDLAGKYLVVWVSAEAIETFLGVLEPRDDTAMMSWIVGGESGPRPWVRVRRVLLPDGRDMPLQEEKSVRGGAVTTPPTLEEAGGRGGVRGFARNTATDAADGGAPSVPRPCYSRTRPPTVVTWCGLSS
jgi:hypothetical protein